MRLTKSLKLMMNRITAEKPARLTRPELHVSPLKELKMAQVAYIEQQLGIRRGSLNGCIRSSCESLNLIVQSV